MGITTPPVRFSSLLILVGVGSYVAYRYLTGQTRKRHKRRAHFQRTSESRTYDHYEEPSDEQSSEQDDDENMSPIQRIWYRRGRSRSRSQSIDTATTSTPHNHYYEEQYGARSTAYDELVLEDQESDIMAPNEASHVLSNITRSFSLVSNGSEFGDGTVAKLDILLNQIEDIKKSVVEIDADLFTVNRVISKPTQNFLRLTVNPDDDSNVEQSMTPASETGNHSPSLEWDFNDFVAQSFAYDSQDMTPVQNVLKRGDKFADGLIRASVQKIVASSAQTANSFNNSLKSSSSSTALISVSSSLNLPIDSSPSSNTSSSSGKGSMASSPGIEKKVHDLIEEARKLGLVNDLLDALLKNVKRDSAYFED